MRRLSQPRRRPKWTATKRRETSLIPRRRLGAAWSSMRRVASTGSQSKALSRSHWIGARSVLPRRGSPRDPLLDRTVSSKARVRLAAIAPHGSLKPGTDVANGQISKTGECDREAFSGRCMRPIRQLSGLQSPPVHVSSDQWEPTSTTGKISARACERISSYHRKNQPNPPRPPLRISGSLGTNEKQADRLSLAKRMRKPDGKAPAACPGRAPSPRRECGRVIGRHAASDRPGENTAVGIIGNLRIIVRRESMRVFASIPPIRLVRQMCADAGAKFQKRDRRPRGLRPALVDALDELPELLLNLVEASALLADFRDGLQCMPSYS